MRTFKITDEELKILQDKFNEYKQDNASPYICFFASKPGCTITIYENKKGEHKATFSGNNIDEELAELNLSNEVIKEKKAKLEKDWLDLDFQIGSDEVGTGDSYLPMIVCAAYVNHNDIDFLNKLGIDDSKKLSDEKILLIGDELVKHFKDRFSKLTLYTEKYNKMISAGENMNSLKARLHNQVLLNLKSKYPNVSNFYVDQFCSPELYYGYLVKDKNILDTITFKTKGETYYPSVAVASVIARYSFLLVKQKLEEHYQMEFPFGSGVAADKFGQAFINKYGVDEYKKIAKINFKNVVELLKNTPYLI